MRMAMPALAWRAWWVASYAPQAAVEDGGVLVVMMMIQAHSDSAFTLSSALLEALTHIFREVLLSSFHRWQTGI